MMGEFVIERRLSYQRGVMSCNLWLFCTSLESALEAGERAVAAIAHVEGVIARLLGSAPQAQSLRRISRRSTRRPTTGTVQR